MKLRTAVITSFLLILGISAQAQWVQLNGPKNNILKFGGDVASLAAYGNYVFASESTVLLTTDYGATWTVRDSGLAGLSVGPLFFSAGNLYVGTDNGLYLSTDVGVSWNLVPITPSGIPNPEVNFIVVNGSNIILANGNGISTTTFFSTDNGSSWNTVDSELPPAVTCFAIMNGNIYAGSNGGDENLSGVFVSTDMGATWLPTDTGERSGKRFVLALLANEGDLIESTLNGPYLSSDGGATWSEIDNGLPDPTLLVSRIHAFAVSGQNLYAGTDGDGIFVSTNNGSTWTALPDIGLTEPYISSILVNNGVLYAGTFGGGVFSSTDNGVHWSVNNPLSSVFSTLNSLDTIGGDLFACTKAGLFTTIDSGANWTIDSNGMGVVSVNTVFGFGNKLFAGTGSNGLFQSTNNGQSWTSVTGGLGSANYSINAITENNGVLYVTSNYGLFVSSDNGVTWKNPGYGGQGSSASAFVATDKILLEGGNPGMSYSPDSGKDWYPLLDGPPYTTVNTFAVIGGVVYCGTSTYGIWSSTNGGMDWTALPKQPTDIDITTLLVSGTDIFAGTATGHIFISQDSGAKWTSIGSGFPVAVEVLSLAVKDGNLYAGTADSAIWVHPLQQKVTPPLAVTPSSPGSEVISVYPNPSTNMLTVVSASGPLWVLDQLGRSYEVTRTGSTLDISQLPSGVYFVSDGHSQAKFVKK